MNQNTARVGEAASAIGLWLIVLGAAIWFGVLDAPRLPWRLDPIVVLVSAGMVLIVLGGAAMRFCRASLPPLKARNKAAGDDSDR